MAEGEEPGDYISGRPDIHDCFFLVGRKRERISTVKYFLANYSSYFRAMLLETDMKEKNSKEDILIPDHEPDVFNLMLSYVYGQHDIKFNNVNQAMRFHILVDKCLMPKLKQLSTNYLVKNCISNLCEVLECAVLLEIKEMEPRAKEVVEKDTKALLSSPDFLNANPAIIEFIVKQEGLNVTEVELWRALVKWAMHQCGNKREGFVLRKKIDNIIKHVQFLRMSLKEFAEDVVSTSILSLSETIDIFVNMATGKGNKLQEAPSKTRKQWSCPLPSTFVLMFPDKQDCNDDYYSWECEYSIISKHVSLLKISFINVLKNINIHYRNSGSVDVKLINTNRNQTVASKNFWRGGGNGRHSLPQVLKLDSDWIIEPLQRYSLCIKIPNGNWSSGRNSRWNIHVGFVTVDALPLDLCEVQLTYVDRQCCNGVQHNLNSLSIIETLTFSI